MGEVEEINWPAEYTELTTIDDLLHCKICYEYVDTSVVTPCSHNYCSICIRKFLHYKTQCPSCYSKIYEKDLHPNRIVDEILSSYLSLRVKLAACVKGVEVKKGLRKVVESPLLDPRTPSKKFKEEREPGVIVSTPKTARHESRIVKTTPVSKLMSTPSTSDKNGTTPKINSIFGSKSIDKSKADTGGKRVPCPVCGIDILETNINRHLDDCLKRQRSMSPPKQVNNGLDPIPKYVTNLMKDSELRKLLKKYGLATTGVRKTLEKRLQRFSVIYNAERDKISPKSLRDIVRQCDEEETAEKNLPKSNTTSNYVQAVDRNTDISVIDKVRKQYLNNNKDDYKKLIESINDRKKKENTVQRSLFPKNDEDSFASTSSASRLTSQSIFDRSGEDTNSSGMDLGQYLPPDSDSSAQCPLQHYSNEDPMRFLALELSSDSDDSPMKFDRICEKKIEENGRIVDEAEATTEENSEEERPAVESKSDIFDASTEDNWSDDEGLKCNGAVLNSTLNNNNNDNNRAKRFSRKARFKLSKKTKRSSGYRSSDSETDVDELGPKSKSRLFGNLKTGGRDSVEKSAGLKDNGILSPELREPGNSSRGIEDKNSLKIDKENLEDMISTAAAEGASGENAARRSTRKRNYVQYASNSSRKKNLKKIETENVLEERSINLIVEREEGDGKTEKETGNKKPLRKRRKIVKK